MDWGLLASYWPFALAMGVTGMVSGVAAGLLGIGGGAVIVPALANSLLLMGYDPDIVQHVAVGTSLAIIIPTGIMSARAHYKRGALDVAVLRLWVPFVVAGTFVGGLMAGLYSGNVLRIIFALLSFFIAANIVFSFQTRLMGHLKDAAWAHRLSAFIVGYISALIGTGGGSLTVPTLVAFGRTMHNAVGTSAAIGVAIALSGTAGFLIAGWGVADLPPASLGFVNLPAFALVGGLAAIFAPFGAALAHRLDQKTLKYVFAAFLVAVGLNMLWKVVLG
ncbi:sulfite exporter TauE/SafE family protein [Devosia elaeis]|nr:sulfite exporter TauE/SafE family protein [Devosia elaeis]